MNLLIGVCDDSNLRDRLIERYEAELEPDVRPYRVTLAQREPSLRAAISVDLVIVRWDNNVSVLYGRCQHQGALTADGLSKGITSSVGFTSGAIDLILASVPKE